MASSWIEEVSEENFEERIMTASQKVPILVDFWAPWCGPCRMLSPILERVIDSFQGKVQLAKLNTDENPELATRFGIQGIPAVKAFVNGQITNEFVGVLPEPQIREFIENLIPSEADLLAQKAKQLESNDPEKALEIYEDALKWHTEHPQSLIGLIRVLLTLNRLEEAKKWYDKHSETLQYDDAFPRLKALLDLAVARDSGPPLSELKAHAEKEPDNLEAQWDLAARLAAEGNYAEALDIYLLIVKKDRRFKEDGARKTILQVFEVVGPRSSLAETYREKLAQIIF